MHVVNLNAEALRELDQHINRFSLALSRLKFPSLDSSHYLLDSEMYHVLPTSGKCDAIIALYT